MLNFAVLFTMILGITKGEGYDGALVRTIEETFEDCSTLVESMGLYLGKRLGDSRRRDANDLTKDVEGKLQTCDALFKVVGTLRSAHADLVRPAFGTIGVYFSQSFFLRAQLSNIGKKIGKVLYIASKDGDLASDFHKACDNKGPTIAIIETTSGSLFGGYTDQTWAGKGFRSSETSFVFSLRPKMKKYAVIKGQEQHSIQCHPKFGPIFGAGSDFIIHPKILSIDRGYSSKSLSYAMPLANYGLKLKDYVVLRVDNL